MGIIFTSIIRAVLLYRICINSNKSIHDKMVSSLLETFIHFFHSNDSGKYLNLYLPLTTIETYFCHKLKEEF